MLPRQGKAKGVHHHQVLIIWNVKGTYLRKRSTFFKFCHQASFWIHYNFWKFSFKSASPSLLCWSLLVALFSRFLLHFIYTMGFITYLFSNQILNEFVLSPRKYLSDSFPSILPFIWSIYWLHHMSDSVEHWNYKCSKRQIGFCFHGDILGPQL